MTGATLADDGPDSGESSASDPIRLWLLLTTTSAIGLLAAVVLLVEKIFLIEDPTYTPTCSIDPILSCGSVMLTWQAEAFGIPNPIIGIVGFSVTLAIGAGLAAGARYRRWYWIGLQAGVTFGVVFVHWLIYQSLYSIGALCPYCMVVWVVTIPIFWYVTLHNLQSGNIRVPPRLGPLVGAAARNHGVILTVWYLVIALLVTVRFWDHWAALIT